MIPKGTEVTIIGARNPWDCPNYDENTAKDHHVGHYLKDGTTATVDVPNLREKDNYFLWGQSDYGERRRQTLHIGQFRIIKEKQQ